MSLEALLFQALNGLAAASSLFLVGAGLSLIFGVTRIVNIAHGSFYMLGLYLPIRSPPGSAARSGFWGGIAAAALVVAALGALIEIAAAAAASTGARTFQLLATFALVLVINDATLCDLGHRRTCSGRAHRLARLGRNSRPPLPELRPVPDRRRAAGAAAALHLMLAKTRFGRLIRAATQDREMVGALGVNQALLFTVVFALGAFLAGLGGALQVAARARQSRARPDRDRRCIRRRRGRRHGLDPGAFLAAMIIAEVKALCIGIGVVHIGGFTVNFSKLTLVAEFLVMAVVLIARPYGLLGRPQGAVARLRPRARTRCGPRPWRSSCRSRGAARDCSRCRSPRQLSPYALVLGIDVLIAILFADSPAFHHGTGRHAFVRPCRLFRPRGLRRGAAW